MLLLPYSGYPVGVEQFFSGKCGRQAAGKQFSARETDREGIGIHPSCAADGFTGSIIYT